MRRPGWRYGRRPWAAGTALLLTWPVALSLTTVWVETGHLASVAAGADVVIFPVLLMAAFLLYLHTRVGNDGDHLEWITVGMVFAASQGVAQAVLRFADSERVSARPGWMALVELLVAVLLLGLVRATHRRPVPGNAFALGLMLGLCVSCVRIGLVVLVSPSPDVQAARPLLAGLVLVLYVATAVALLRLSPPEVAGHLAVVAVLLGVSRVLTHPAPADDLRSVAAVLADLAAAVLLCAVAWRLLLESHRKAVRLEWLQEKLEMAEAEVREDRSVLHDVVSAAAGISSASQLLASASVLEPRQREQLVQMVAVEASRLQRLARGRGSSPVAPIDLDGVLGPVVVAHLARGRDVEWQASSLWAVGSADGVAEVVDILLDNCGRHSGAATSRVDVRNRAGAVEITVSDQGCGMPADLARRALDWGTHGPDSTGQGIGLSVASELATRQGGELSMVSRPGCGTAATLRLPAVATGTARERVGAHAAGHA